VVTVLWLLAFALSRITALLLLLLRLRLLLLLLLRLRWTFVLRLWLRLNPSRRRNTFASRLLLPTFDLLLLTA
jgi:hypothetical protein